jgi:predicted TIM-barrel fold metal-dependent hydrolase
MGGSHNEGVDAAALSDAELDRAASDSADALRAGPRGAEPAWVDAHVHVFPPEMIQGRESCLPRDRRFAALYADPRARMVTAGEVVAEMDRTGVATSVVFGFPFRDQGLCRAANDYVLEAVAAWPERLAGLACVSPAEPGAAAELARCLDAGMRGSGELAPDGSSEDIDGLKEVAGLLRERGLPLLLHSNEPVGHAYPGKSGFGPAACVASASAYPGLTFVFAHMGGGAFVYEAMPELRKTLADVYYDTAALPYLYDSGIYRAVQATAGAHKLLFGSDYALLSPARYRAGLSELSPAARAAICCDNARKVFRL